MSSLPFNAVIFDLDGVITKTALVHSAAWKKMFDEFMQKWCERHHLPFREFDHERDYLPYIDGKPRYEGVKSFLEHRGIYLPWGDPSDPPDKETICGLGNRKNQVFNEVLERDGVEVYPSTIRLIQDLLEKGVKVGVASSSKNCESVLKAAGIENLFFTRVDGVVSSELGLKGKPEPDIFITACYNLGSTPDQAIVVEDAVSGVQAGKAGNFGCVIGIAREKNARELKQHGADIVVEDLSFITVKDLEEWFQHGLEEDNWSLSYYEYDPDRERSREALLTIGNGYLGTRGCMEEVKANAVNYPGTYIAGLYNRLTSHIAGRAVENEDFVNIPNWLEITFRIDDSDWFDPNRAEILDCYRCLDFRTGVLEKVLSFRDHAGRETIIRSKRFASMNNPHLAGLQYTITPLNYNGTITVKSILDGNIINDGVARYRQLNQQHLQPYKEGFDGNLAWLMVQTTQSAIQIALATDLKVLVDHAVPSNITWQHHTRIGEIDSTLSIPLNSGQILTIEKIAAIYTNKQDDSKDPLQQATQLIRNSPPFQDVLNESINEWKKIWNKIDIRLRGDRLSQKLLRLHLYHLMVSFSPHNQHLDASITARGLHGEAYRGHIFWDELYILPLYAIHFPEVARAMLMYRYRRLDKAREYARQHGYQGAMFPWQSGSDGREETQVVHLNPVSGQWGDDYSSLQRHVSLAVGYNVWNYWHITGDNDFLKDYGMEMLIEICRFWASKAEWNEQIGRYSISRVMGPDEFHEAYHGATEGGLKDNAYTNLMTSWLLNKTIELLNHFPEEERMTIKQKFALKDQEIIQWKKISERLFLCIENDIIAQFDGYFQLKDLDWDYYRNKYGNIYRMDRLLKAEGQSPDEYKVAKQADTLMVFYNLAVDEVTRILQQLGYLLADNYFEKNFDYYLARTSHGSTLSRVVHAYLAHLLGKKELAWKLYSEALASDYIDIQGGTTAEGIHTGVMAATVYLAIKAFAGVVFRDDMIAVRPDLPASWRQISFTVLFRGNQYTFEISPHTVKISMIGATDEVRIEINGKVYQLNNRQKITVTTG